MSWHGIQGHDRVVEQFRRAIGNGRMASTFLFVGPGGIGKRRFALKLAQALLCERHELRDLDPCQRCPACQQVDALTHPDLEICEKPKDRSFIPVERFIGDREHRMREGLCHNIALKPYRGGRKVAIIDDADFLNQEGANCLLKMLEEPPPKSVIILIGTSEQKQLPTIRSRSQIVRFQPLDDTTIAELLLENGVVDDPALADRLAALSGGSLETAVHLADPALQEFRKWLLSELSQRDFDAVELAKTVSGFVDEAGKDAPPRRQRMTEVIAFATDFYRQRMRSLSGRPTEGDEALRQAVDAANRDDFSGDAEAAAACLERCIDAVRHVQANANQATLLECWMDDLATISRTGQPLSFSL